MSLVDPLASFLKHVTVIFIFTIAGLKLLHAGENPDATKIDYQVNPQFQDIIASDQGEIPVPAYPLASRHFVFGGIFSMTNIRRNNTLIIRGIEEALAMQCAVSDLNDFASNQNSTLKFYYQIINDRNSLDDSMRAAVQLIESGIPAIIGTSGSNTAVQVAALAAGYDVPMLSASATADLLSDRIIYGSFFRMVPSDVAVADAITNIMLFFNWTLVSAIFSGTPFGQSGQRQFLTKARERNINITCTTAIPQGDVSTVPLVGNCLASSQATVVLLWMSADDAVDVISVLNQNGSLRDLVFILPGYWMDYPDVETFTGGKFPVSYLQGSIIITPRNGEITSFLKCLNNMKPNNVTLPRIREYFQIRARCKLGDDSLPTCHPDITSRARSPNFNCSCPIDERLHFYLPLSTVNYVYDAVAAIANAVFQINNNCTGLENVTGIPYCSQASFHPPELTQAIRASTFRGKTGPVGFTEFNNPINVDLEINQIDEYGEINNIGYAIPSAFYINTTFTSWKHNKQPVSAIIPLIITISSSALGGIVVGACSAGILAAIILTIYIYRYRNNIIIRQVSFLFTELMLLGIVLCLGSQILWSIDQTTTICILKVWMLALGFGLIMANLLAKTNRIYRIFRNTGAKTVVIKDSEVLIYVAAIMSFELLLLSLYTFGGGLPTPEIIQSQSDVLLLYIQCRTPANGWQLMGIITLELFNFSLVVCACIFGYLTRNASTDYNESSDIAYTVYVYFLVALILVPLYYTAGDSPSSISRQFIFRSLVVILAMYFTLATLFLPKVSAIREVEKINKNIRQQEEKKRRQRIMQTGIPGAEMGEDFPFTNVMNNHQSYLTLTAAANIMEESDEDEGDMDRYFPGQKTERRNTPDADTNYKALYLRTLTKK